MFSDKLLKKALDNLKQVEGRTLTKEDVNNLTVIQEQLTKVRELYIVKRYNEQASLASISRELNLTPSRISQIYHGHNRKEPKKNVNEQRHSTSK